MVLLEVVAWSDGSCKRCVGASVLIPTTLDLLRNCESNLPHNEGRSGTWRGLCDCNRFIYLIMDCLCNLCFSVKATLCKAREKPIWSLHNVMRS